MKITTLLFALSATLLAAQTYTIDMATDRANALYKQGETATFFVTVKKDGQPFENAEIKWRLTKDNVAPFITYGSKTLENGTASFSGTLDEPGFLTCRIDFKSPEGKPAGGRAGAAFDPQDIKTCAIVPDDFDAFWVAQKQTVRKTPLDITLTSVETKEKSVNSFDVLAKTPEGPITAYLSIPANAAPKSLPIIITTQGAGVSTANLGKTLEWAKEGFIALDFNIHGTPNGQTNEYYLQRYQTDLKDYFIRGRDNRETFYFRGAFLRLVRAIDLATEHPAWDGKTIVVYGGSQGGAQAFAAAGLHEKVTLFVAGIPGMCDLTGETVGRINGWPYNRPDGKPQTPEIIETAQYFDAANFAARIKAQALVTAGFADNVCPPTTIYAAYNNLKGRKEILPMPLVDHRNTPEAVALSKKTILEHAQQMRAQ